MGAFAADVLETTDVLDKALASVPLEAREKDAALAGLYEGVVLTRRALAQTLAHEGVVPMPDSAGAKFDPKRHEALAQVEEGTPGEIAEVVEPGWMIRDRVLRPAKVNVVKIE